MALLSFHIFFIAPSIVGFFIDDFIALFLSQASIAMMQIILFSIFMYFMIIPITETLREEKAGQIEIFLAAPLKPSDILLGEFLGETPFYIIIITVITGLFAAILEPVGLNIIQNVIVVIVFVTIFLSGSWIGSVIAAFLRTRLGKTSHGKDVGKALAMIIALPMVGLFYAIQFGGLLKALADPYMGGIIKAILSLLPSSWGADIIVGFATGYLGMGEALTRLGGLVIFLGIVLWLGFKIADRVYSLEPAKFTASRVKSDKLFYKSVKYLGGGSSFGTILVSLFKDYARRLENLSNLTYMIGLVVLMNIFIIPNTVTGESDLLPFDMSMMMIQFIIPIVIVMVTGDVTVQGKDSLFLYRKAPSGEWQLIKAMLMKSWLIAGPIAGGTTVVTTLLVAEVNTFTRLISTGLIILFVISFSIFVLGLFLLNPAFSTKSVRLGLNVMISVFVSVGLFGVSLFILTIGGQALDSTIGILYIQILQTIISLFLGIFLLFLGKRKLSRIE